MSREYTIGYATSAVNKRLADSGVKERLAMEELASLQKYQGVRSHPDSVFLMNCAQMAMEEVRSLGGFSVAVLTEYGVVADYNYKEGAGEGKFLEASVRMTRDFLARWERIIREQETSRQALSELTDATRAMVNNTFYRPTLEAVQSFMQGSGFELSTPEALLAEPSIIFEKGIALFFQGQNGASCKLCFHLPGGQSKLDYTAPAGQELLCEGAAQKLLEGVSALLVESSERFGLPIGITSHLSTTMFEHPDERLGDSPDATHSPSSSQT